MLSMYLAEQILYDESKEIEIDNSDMDNMENSNINEPNGNVKVLTCQKCHNFNGYLDGFCSVCFKEVNNLDNFGIAKTKYLNAIKMTSVAFSADIIISYVLYPREYYHDSVKYNQTLKETQLVYDSWYQYSKKNGKLKRSKYVLKKMIAKQNINQFISLLYQLQPWMKAKDICDIIICLPPIDDTLNNYREKKKANAKKIIALTYFGVCFHENHGQYLSKIIAQILCNCGGDFICYKFYNFGESPWMKYFGRHALIHHISEKYIQNQVDYKETYEKVQSHVILPPKVDEKTIVIATTVLVR